MTGDDRPQDPAAERDPAERDPAERGPAERDLAERDPTEGDPAERDLAERDLTEVLTRWHQAGAVWRVVARSRSQVTVALCRCDGGEEVERLTTAHPGTLQFLAGRDSSDD